MKYIKYLFALICVFSITLSVKAYDIPVADESYFGDFTSHVIDSNKTIELDNVYSVVDPTYGSPIKIVNNSTVNIVLKGDNVLTGNPSAVSAGIEVEEGSTVNIYGYEGATLYVTGGNLGAGIGGVGYTSVSASNPKAGNINIYSGSITAIGGNRAAGIGSGYHSSASEINIYGGNIEAYGTGFGAGIGSGYGTSGGAAVAAGVGFYNGGNITITGGTVKASSYNINFDSFDPYNLATLYDDSYTYTRAAGIGGGYGASSGNIVIGGNAKVIAVGSDGATGIGSGRGTTKESNYDANNFDVNITIKDNANVMAFTTDDIGPTIIGDNGGAAIGLGRGTTLVGEPKGTVKIKDNASVYAVASYHAQAIGASNIVGSFTKDAEGNVVEPPTGALETLEIDPTANVIAISDGYSDPVSATSNFVKLSFDKYFLEKIDNNQFPLIVDAFNASNENLGRRFSIQNQEPAVVMVQLSETDNYNFSLLYAGALLANSVEDKMSDFKVGNEYDVNKLSDTFFAYSVLSTDFGDLNIQIIAPAGVFELGSTFNLELISDENKILELIEKTDANYSKNLDEVFFIDISVSDSNGNKYSKLPDKAKVYIQIPEGWNPELMKVLFIKSGTDEDLSSSQRVEVIDGIKYLVVELEHFSNYGVYLYNQPTTNTNTGINTVTNPNTSDNIITYIILLISSLLSIITITRIKKYN